MAESPPYRSRNAMQVINLADKLALFQDTWSPRVVAALNDYHVKLVRLHGEFVWHSHADTDELFLVLSGHLTIRFRDSEARLGPGELLVVPRGVDHLPVADEECQVLLLEPAGTINTGAAGGPREVRDPAWI